MQTITQGIAKMGPNLGDAVKVMLATEEPLLALGATSLLAAAVDFTLTKCAATYPELIPLLEKEQPDLLLLDLAPEITPALFGVAHRAAPDCRIVLWARSVTDEVAFQAGECGVSGFICRTASNEQFLEQLRRIARGLNDMERPAPPRSAQVPLTPRESQLVGLLAQGLKNKEIATCLNLSEGTVKSYLVHLFRKTGVRDRFELALLGLKNTYCGEAFWDGQRSFVTEPEEERARPVLRSLVLVEPARRRGYPEAVQKAAGADV
jgi:two-component system, NarL family, nitrate/nitrite response regulator NarL